ncbi:MAG: CaiB/BaiF CoA transferase family protein [Flammeovirgaceae bacterium]
MSLPFKGYRLVELANVLAGPSVGQFFAELGAEVIKVENPKTNGDVTRNWKLPTEGETSVSAYFSSVNWGKTSILLDMKNPTDKEQVYELVRDCDLVVASFKPGDAQKLGLDYETLSAINPRLIYGCITGYGETDDRVGYDAIIQAEAGFMHMNGEPEGKPTKMPVALVDVLAAHQLKEGMLLALIQRMQSGKGAKVSVSLIEAAISALVNQATNWLNAGHISQRMGSEHPNIVPYGTVFTTKDQQAIILAVGTDKQFNLLCNILNLSEDERFATNPLRVKHKAQLLPLLYEKIKEWEVNELMKLLGDAKVPAGIINQMDGVFELPQAKAISLTAEGWKGVRQFIAEMDSVSRTELSPPPQLP